MKKNFTQKVLVLLALILCTVKLNAQITIGADQAPNADAVLDIVSNNKGLLLPRVSLTSTDAASPLSAHVAGMLVYNIATAGTEPTNVTPGIYFNNGTSWLRTGDFGRSASEMPSGTWIYCPPFELAWTSGETGKTVNLFDHYTNGLSGYTTSSNSKMTTGSTEVLDLVSAATDFDYLVRYHGSSITITNIDSSTGIMTYSCNTTVPSNTDFLSVILIKK